VDVLQEIGNAKEAYGDAVKTRLEEVINHLNMDTNIRERDRRVRLASAYAAKILEENRHWPRSRDVEEVINQIRYEAENLEKIWFYHYTVEGKPNTMRIVDYIGCDLGRNGTPLLEGRSGYSCRKGTRPCEVGQFVSEGEGRRVVAAVSAKEISVRSKRLRNGAEMLQKIISTNQLKTDRSIGQKMCHPIGDCIIVSKALSKGFGILTGDKDQVALAEHFSMKYLFYNSIENIIS
jgi:hypothetical protein